MRFWRDGGSIGLGNWFSNVFQGGSINTVEIAVISRRLRCFCCGKSNSWQKLVFLFLNWGTREG